MRFHAFLLLLALHSPRARAENFNEKIARSGFLSGAQPTIAELTGSAWIQIGGVNVPESETAALFGPIGYDGNGLLRAARASSLHRSPSQTILEFRPSSAAAPGAVQFFQLFSAEKFKSGAGESTLDESDFSYRQNYAYQGANLLGKTVCRFKAPVLLLCALYKEGEESPAYYSLFRKTGANLSGARAAPIPLPTTAAPKMSRALKCALPWKNGKVEMMSFTFLSKPVPVGPNVMYAVGGSWPADHPNDLNRVIVVAIEGGAGSQRVHHVHKPLTPSLAPDKPLRLVSGQGLPLVGTITVPATGGAAEVRYPPGSGQSAADYAKTLMEAPTQGHCEDLAAPEPPDPYSIDAGVVR